MRFTLFNALQIFKPGGWSSRLDILDLSRGGRTRGSSKSWPV